VSDVETAGILRHARERTFPRSSCDRRENSATKLEEEAEHTFVETLRGGTSGLIVLAGFMRVLKGEFLRTFEGVS